MVNGSAKGSAFERSVCKTLSLWFSKGKRDDLFWRTSGSGARATVRGKKGKSTISGHGDIEATCSEGKLLTEWTCWELKCGYDDVDFLGLAYENIPKSRSEERRVGKECVST